MAKEVLQQIRSLDGGERFSTISQGSDEELVESMAKQVVECLKESSTSKVRVGGWSGIGRKRVMDHVAAAIHDHDFFSGCVRVAYKPYIPVEYEIRKKIEQTLKMDLLGGGNIYWREILTVLKWKPLVVIVDNLEKKLDNRDALGIPEFVTDTRDVKHLFLKLVFTDTCPSFYWLYAYGDEVNKVDKEFEDGFGELPDDVALRMILYEAHSSAISTVESFPDVIRWNFESKKEEMTCMMLPSLAPTALLYDNRVALSAESVIQYLFSLMLFTDVYDFSFEILPRPCFDNNENSWEAALLLFALSMDLEDRRLTLNGGFEHVYNKLAASASSSSSGIMTQFQGYLVRRSRSLELVDMAEWSQDLTRISFADNLIKEVVLPPPSAPAKYFPNLSALILRKNPLLEEIPDDAFRYMPNLRILDLSFCGIGMLPSSLSSLWNLRILGLSHCSKLQTIETTGLDNLEVLNLADCPLPTLHKAAWCHMHSLKRLSFKNGLRSLAELQLSLKNVKVFDDFDIFSIDLRSLVPRADTLQKCNISILYPKDEEEQEEMRRRRTLDAHVLRSDHFPYKDIHAQVVRHMDTVEYPIVAAAGVDNPHEKCLEINGGEGLWSLYTLSLIFQPRLLSLQNYQHAEAGIWPIPELKTCYIKYCSDIEYAFNSPERRKDLWNLKNLETLWISSLTKLSAICNNRFEQNESFCLLKSIYIEYCPNLLVLFPVTIRLPNLEAMEIKFCAMLGKLFTQHTAAGEIVLPRLKRLRLCGLPKLTSICEEGDLPLLQKLEVRGCWNLKNVPIFPSGDVAKEVLVVRGEEGWWKNVQGGFKKEDQIDFRMGFASAAQKHIPQRWKRGPRRPRRRLPLSL